MQTWNDIIHTALLGTDKKELMPNQLPAPLAAAANLINGQETLDKEDKFLQLAAVSANYRRCGRTPLDKTAIKENITIPEAEAERWPYAPEPAMQVLRDIIAEEEWALMYFWVQEAIQTGRLVRPEMIPELLNRAAVNKAWQPLIARVCGKRGEWLSRFNSNWQFTVPTDEEDLWQTGTPEQRKTMMRQLRQTDPDQARELLLQTWPEETANARADLLKQWRGTVTSADQLWLEGLLEDKSQKVREEALYLLQRIPGSRVVGRYWEIARQAVQTKTERSLLGITKNTVLQIDHSTPIPEDIFKLGIARVSTDKNIPDEEYVLGEIIAGIPPSMWEGHLGAKADQVIGYFEKAHKQYIPALIRAIVRFKDVGWALAFMQHGGTFYIDIIPLLPPQQQEYYSLKFFGKFPDSIIGYAREREALWSKDLTMEIIRHTANMPHQYNITFYRENIHRIHSGIGSELDGITLKEGHWQGYWDNIKGQLQKLLALKDRTMQAFRG